MDLTNNEYNTQGKENNLMNKLKNMIDNGDITHLHTDRQKQMKVFTNQNSEESITRCMVENVDSPLGRRA